jgi:hypothetical protein
MRPESARIIHVSPPDASQPTTLHDVSGFFGCHHTTECVVACAPVLHSGMRGISTPLEVEDRSMQGLTIRRALLMVVAVACLSLAVPPGTTAQNGGNSANAHACQNGAWAGLARQEDPVTPFQNQGECVSHAAQGGTLRDLFILNPVISVTMAPVPGYNACGPTATITGFAPNTDYLVETFIWNSGEDKDGEMTISTDEFGSATFGGAIFSPSTWVKVRFVVGGISSAAVPYSC